MFPKWIDKGEFFTIEYFPTQVKYSQWEMKYPRHKGVFVPSRLQSFNYCVAGFDWMCYYNKPIEKTWWNLEDAWRDLGFSEKQVRKENTFTIKES